MIFLVYKTDNWHSYASRDLIGVATSHARALTICRKQAKKEHTRIDDEQLFYLNNINQTQGYSGDGEIVIEPVEKNKLL